MASVESIGACSLDLEASGASDVHGMRQLTASEMTLQSTRVVPSINGSVEYIENPHDPSTKEKRFRTHTFLYIKGKPHMTNGHVQKEKRECTVAEIKLPSYVSISCAINGYTNYSRFCRSRDNSPARVAFRKASLDTTTEEKSSDSFPGSNFKCTRSLSECNGTANGVFTESKQVTVSKQLQIPLKSTKKYMTEITINSNSHSSETKDLNENLSDIVENGHSHREFTLAKEVGTVGTKSLVQQRIESLYRNCSPDKPKFSGRVSRHTEHHMNGSSNKTPVSKRSPSCPPQAVNYLGSEPPVFRHLTNDFRKQLQLNGEVRECHLESYNKSKSKEENSSYHLKHSNGIKKKSLNETLPTPITNGIDECDKAVSTPSGITSIANNVTKVIFDENSRDTKESKEGYKFLEIMNAEKDNILYHIKQWEEELKNDVPEDASGKIRAACGKANLLLNQKFEQFKGLCLKNIEEDSAVPFYTTAADLAGFWDMVMLQVKDVITTFSNLQQMKKNNWQEISPSMPVTTSQKPRKPTTGSKSNPCTPKRTAKSVELARARDEARKQLLAAKKRGRQQNIKPDDSDISIFTPGSPS